MISIRNSLTPKINKIFVMRDAEIKIEFQKPTNKYFEMWFL